MGGLALAIDQQRDIFAGVVGALEGRVVAVVGGDDQEVVLAQQRQIGGQPLVGLFEAVGVAARVAPVAVEHVIVNVVGHDQARFLFAGPCFDQRLRVHVVARVHGFGNAAMGVDVLDLADGIDRDAGLHEALEDGFLVRQIGEVLAVFGAFEAAGFADEGAGDDPAHAQGVAEAAGDLAIAVEFGHGHDLLVGGDLEDAVGGGVANQRAGLEMLLAEFLDDYRAAGGLVANQLAPGLALEISDQVGRERVFEGEVVEAGLDLEAGDFPVAGDGVLALGDFAHGAVGGVGRVLGRDAGNGQRRLVVQQGGDVAQAHLLHGGQIHAADGRGQIGEGGGAGIAVISRVRRGANAHGVENNQDGFHAVFPCRGAQTAGYGSTGTLFTMSGKMSTPGVNLVQRMCFVRCASCVVGRCRAMAGLGLLVGTPRRCVPTFGT